MMMHPSKEIMFKKSRILEGKRIALCTCGSASIIKAIELSRELMRNGAEVFVVMTRSSRELVSPKLFEWATGNPVITEITGKIEHVLLSKNIDLILIAPASANTIGKIVAGIGDTPVTLLVLSALGLRIPILIVPAMHGSMYSNPIVLNNLDKLNSMGIRVFQPEFIEDKAKFPNIEDVVEEVIAILHKKDLLGKSVLVTAGPTRSYIDSIRFITNSSSGKMGYAFAKEAHARGAQVTLISGPTNISPPKGIRVVNVETTEEMFNAVDKCLSEKNYDVVIMAAAPLDFSVENKHEGKIPSNYSISIKLNPLPKIIDLARKRAGDSFLIGFKAEYGLKKEELISKAKEKLLECGADLIVANDLSMSIFGSDTNEVYVIDKFGSIIHLPLSSKRDIASKILDIYVRSSS